MSKITTALIPIGGFGTRFFPQTRAFPKEMLPLVDKPVIQYIVENLVTAGIKHIIFATNSHKGIIENHFDLPNMDIIYSLENNKNKKKILSKLEKIATMARFSYVRDRGPRGTAAPIYSAEHLLSIEEGFIYTTADDLILAFPNEFEQLVEAYNTCKSNYMACIESKDEIDYERYAFIKGKLLNDNQIKIGGIVYKPGRENAPSKLAAISSCLFTKDIISYVNIAAKSYKKNSDFSLAKIIQDMINDNKSIIGLKIMDGNFIDVGNKLDYLKALVHFGANDDEISAEFTDWLIKYKNIKTSK